MTHGELTAYHDALHEAREQVIDAIKGGRVLAQSEVIEICGSREGALIVSETLDGEGWTKVRNGRVKLAHPDLVALPRLPGCDHLHMLAAEPRILWDVMASHVNAREVTS